MAICCSGRIRQIKIMDNTLVQLEPEIKGKAGQLNHVLHDSNAITVTLISPDKRHCCVQ